MFSGMRNTPVRHRSHGTRSNPFFVSYVLDDYGDLGSDYGQKVNEPRFGELGSCALNDPPGGGQVDPKWSLDANKLVYCCPCVWW
jgi:hypothetical protein